MKLCVKCLKFVGNAASITASFSFQVTVGDEVFDVGKVSKY